MALYQSYTFSNIATLLSDLATFASGNGWTIGELSLTRVTMSKAGTLFRVDFNNSTTVVLYATPGGGVTNPSPAYLYSFAVGAAYMFVSSGASLYIGRVSAGGAWNWGGLSNVVDKIGSWPGGVGVCGFNGDTKCFCTSYSYQCSAYYINGSWSYIGWSLTAGAVVGGIDNDVELMDKQAFIYNAGILPVHVPLFVLHSTTSLWRPIGFAEGVFRFRAGDIYVAKDEITIGSDTYLAMPFGAATLSHSNSKDLLFKLGA